MGKSHVGQEERIPMNEINRPLIYSFPIRLLPASTGLKRFFSKISRDWRWNINDIILKKLILNNMIRLRAHSEASWPRKWFLSLSLISKSRWETSISLHFWSTNSWWASLDGPPLIGHFRTKYLKPQAENKNGLLLLMNYCQCIFDLHNKKAIYLNILRQP